MMRKMILATLLAAVAAGPVLAQDRGELRENRREYREDRRDFREDRRDFRQDRRDYRQGEISRGEFRDERRDFRGDRRDFREDRRDFRDDRRDIRNDRREFWNDRGWRGQRTGWRDNRWYGNWNGGSYYHPRGYAYRPYSVGLILPRAYWNDGYYISRYDDYRLGRPGLNRRWVRVGPDALLINVRTGRVIDVVRGRFW